jgi:hypothetical protein
MHVPPPPSKVLAQNNDVVHVSAPREVSGLVASVFDRAVANKNLTMVVKPYCFLFRFIRQQV